MVLQIIADLANKLHFLRQQNDQSVVSGTWKQPIPVLDELKHASGGSCDAATNVGQHWIKLLLSLGVRWTVVQNVSWQTHLWARICPHATISMPTNTFDFAPLHKKANVYRIKACMDACSTCTWVHTWVVCLNSYRATNTNCDTLQWFQRPYLCGFQLPSLS